MRRLFFIIMLASTHAAWAQRPPAVLPTDPDSVLERLPSGYAELMPSGNPAQGISSISKIQKLLEIAAHTGDARLAARADALLDAMPRDTSNLDVIRARAFSAQHRHDFEGARRMLETLIRTSPRDGDARLSRAQINLVQGRLKEARSDCAILTLSVDEARGLLCIASLSLRMGEFVTARDLVDRWLVQTPSSDPSRRYVLVTRAEIAWRNGDRDADVWYRQAIAQFPNDTRTLASYSRFLRAMHRDAEVRPLLAGAADNDGLQLQRTLAAHALGSSEAQNLIEAQGRRYELAHEAGSQPEMRDEAEYLLTLRDDPDAALALALRNFESQRDYEDVDILVRSAKAADRHEALAPLHAWARTQHLTISENK